jgi:DNA-binding MarR family transcriptional regulator
MARQASRPARSSARFTPLELAAWRGLLTVYAKLSQELDDQLQAEQGLPLSSYDVLVHLNEATGGQLRMTELADRILLSKSGLTRVIDALEAQGLVKRVRAEHDARGFYATITREGRARFRAAHRAHVRGVRERFLDLLTQDELRTLADAWQAVRPGVFEPDP